MTLPRTGRDPTARNRVPAVQPLTPASTVAEARAHLRATGESVAPILRHGRPVGLVSAAALHDAERCGSCDAPVSAVMDYLAVPVPR